MTCTQKFSRAVKGSRVGLLKGARLIVAYALAAGLSVAIAKHTYADLTSTLSLTSGITLWACVSESAFSYRRALWEVALLVLAGAAASSLMLALSAHIPGESFQWSNYLLVIGAFLVASLRSYGSFFAGLGSQTYIGLLLAGGCKPEFPWRTAGPLIFIAALVSATVPQILLHPLHVIEEEDVVGTDSFAGRWHQGCWLGLQAAFPAIVILITAHFFHLSEAAWAITAAAYVVSLYSSATAGRIRQRLVGTAIGVPLGLIFLVLSPRAHIVIWGFAAAGMILYAVSLPKRYDMACASYAFVLMLTMIANGERSVVLLASRIGETLFGCVLAYLSMIAMSSLRIVTLDCTSKSHS